MEQKSPWWWKIPKNRFDVIHRIRHETEPPMELEDFFFQYEPCPVEGWRPKVAEVPTLHEVFGYDS